MYGQMTDGELQRVRYSILNFFQDIRIRVSIFLRKGVQNNDGSFVIPSDLTISYGRYKYIQIRDLRFQTQICHIFFYMT
jgi:Organic solute transport protein 1.